MISLLAFAGATIGCLAICLAFAYASEKIGAPLVFALLWLFFLLCTPTPT